jgi:hypothetical protein
MINTDNLTPQLQAEVDDLLLELTVLAARRSMIPSVRDNVRMRLIFERLFMITEDPIFNLTKALK